jgi:hypothetical protein
MSKPTSKASTSHTSRSSAAPSQAELPTQAPETANITSTTEPAITHVPDSVMSTISVTTAEHEAHVADRPTTGEAHDLTNPVVPCDVRTPQIADETGTTAHTKTRAEAKRPLTLTVSSSLLAKLKIIAAAEGKSMSQIVVEAVENGIGARLDAAVARLRQ